MTLKINEKELEALFATAASSTKPIDSGVSEQSKSTLVTLGKRESNTTLHRFHET
jgi:hypothetical protein